VPDLSRQIAGNALALFMPNFPPTFPYFSYRISHSNNNIARERDGRKSLSSLSPTKLCAFLIRWENVCKTGPGISRRNETEKCTEKMLNVYLK